MIPILISIKSRKQNQITPDAFGEPSPPPIQARTWLVWSATTRDPTPMATGSRCGIDTVPVLCYVNLNCN